MLTVKTQIGPSTIHGMGLFAAQDIPKGKIIWEFLPGLDLILTNEDLARLPPLVQEHIKHYGYYNREKMAHILCADNARFTNHSDSPNTDSIGSNFDDEGVTVTNRFVYAGEEITEDYRLFDANFGVSEGEPHVIPVTASLTLNRVAAILNNPFARKSGSLILKGSSVLNTVSGNGRSHNGNGNGNGRNHNGNGNGHGLHF